MNVNTHTLTHVQQVFQFSCAIQTSPTDCSETSGGTPISERNEHGAV